MGWLFTPGQTRKELVARRTTGWNHSTPEGVTLKSTCLKHCYRGGAFSGVLWTIWERTFEKDGAAVQPAQRWIGCDLLRFYREEGWGYKDMAEEMGPYVYSCPLGYLTIVPVADADWRYGVRAYHERIRTKRAARQTARA